MNTIVLYLPFVLIYCIIAIYAERKIAAFIQDRYGPMEVGPYGILQTVADLFKLLQKEDIVPGGAQALLFRITPILLFIIIFAAFGLLPLSVDLSGASFSSGAYFLLAILSLDVITILVAGWSSNNKYSTMGAFRSAAQLISYEVPLGLTVVCVCLMCRTLDFQEIARQQSPVYEGLAPWLSNLSGLFCWNIIRMPILIPAWVIFFIASLAECNRAPFDLPEAESELVAGFHTEYSGFRWATIMLSEYALMLLVSILGSLLFFGAWNSPFPNLGPVRLADWTNGTPGQLSADLWGMFWLLGKSSFFVCVQMWVRWTYPRLRVDQLMTLGWKYLTPMALILVVLCCLWRLIFH